MRARPCSRNRAGGAAREGRLRLPAPLTAQDAAEEVDGKGEPDLEETKMGCTGGRGRWAASQDALGFVKVKEACFAFSSYSFVINDVLNRR